MLDYYPVMMHTVDIRPNTFNRIEIGLSRFEQLNGKRPQVVTRTDFPELKINPYWYLFWVWDAVPTTVDTILVFDSKLLPIYPLPKLSEDIVFAAASDRTDRIRQGKERSDVIKATNKYYQMHLFIAHRSTRDAFEELKQMVELPIYNKPDIWGADGRAHFTPFNTIIQRDFDVYELPKTWNWLITYEKEFYTANPYMINLGGVSTWSYYAYISTLIAYIESKSGGVLPSM